MATFPTNVLCNYFVKIDFRDDEVCFIIPDIRNQYIKQLDL